MAVLRILDVLRTCRPLAMSPDAGKSLVRQHLSHGAILKVRRNGRGWQGWPVLVAAFDSTRASGAEQSCLEVST